FVKFAGAAYCEQGSVLDWSCDNCNGYADGSSEAVYFNDEETNTAGYLAVNQAKHLIVLGYRGTQDIVNWIHNLDISLVDANLGGQYSDAGFHSGFNTMTNALLKDSTDALQNALSKYPTFKVVFTGHSLGGALAALTAFKLAQAKVIDWEKINLITYGQPRLGNLDFADFLNSQPWTSTRVTSYGDLVAISPGRTIGYAHNQYNMHINSDG
ncbi:alpha/beta-hydrolase, partial [Conidiobolus coronatus NRRL 28638]